MEEAGDCIGDLERSYGKLLGRLAKKPRYRTAAKREVGAQSRSQRDDGKGKQKSYELGGVGSFDRSLRHSLRL